MTILLFFYLIFLAAYIIFNIYAVFKVSSMRAAGDSTGLSIFIYILTISFLILVSLILIAGLDWKMKFNIFG
jgi:hypothetical protein